MLPFGVCYIYICIYDSHPDLTSSHDNGSVEILSNSQTALKALHTVKFDYEVV